MVGDTLKAEIASETERAKENGETFKRFIALLEKSSAAISVTHT
jgi:hypothetical protein